ncbi:MAG: hypothetical protein ACREA5_02570, partial [Nitrosotalea sp.]
SNGNAFTSPIVISSNKTNSQPLQLIAIENHVYVTMMDGYAENGTLPYNISFRTSSDNGTTFGRSVNLLQNPLKGLAIPSPIQIQTAENGRIIYVIGEYFPDCLTFSTAICTNQIFFEKSEDFGTTFSVPRIIYSTHQFVEDLHTYASEKNVYLVWGENQHDINFMNSSDGGKTFSIPNDLTKSTSVGKVLFPNGIGLAANGLDVYVIE